MASRSTRVFTFTMAILFFVTAFGFSFLVIWQSTHSNSNASDQNTSQNSCTDNKTNEPVLPAPAASKPPQPVTLQITDLQKGSGPAAKDGDCLVVKYYGTLASTGVEFDENFSKPTAFAFLLGQGQVIKGWDVGMVGMQAGGTRRLVLPAALAYGSQSPSPAIPANSDLVFLVKLLRIQ